MYQQIYTLIAGLDNKITNMVKRCALTKTAKDSKDYQVVQTQYLGKTAHVESASLYGICFSPPINSTGLLLTVLGDEENRIAFFNLTQERFKNLKVGELQIGNLLTRSSIKFDEFGDIIIESVKGVDIQINEGGLSIKGKNGVPFTGDVNIETEGNVNVKTPTMTVDGNLNVTGTITATQDVISGTVSGKTHVHSGVESGPSNSGPPIP